jgi:two-component system nitrate/nitrite response regulator NarL
LFIDVYQANEEQQLNEICRDLREPVASIRETAAAALAGPGLETQVRRRLEQIAGQADWLASIINDCLRTECQQHGVNGTADGPANVACVINEAVAACRLTWPGDLSVTSPPGPVLCAQDPVILRRIISNVLSNATRAAGPSGVVAVEIKRDRSMTVVMVEDSGPGFGKIPRGHGIGLAEVASNVIRYGGKVECSRGARGGVRVSLWLPSVRLSAVRLSAEGAGPMRLVLCDDNRILCEALGAALERHGHEVLAAVTCTERGIAAVAAHHPDACLLDLRFPDPPDGLMAAHIIREFYPGTAVLVLSGMVDPAARSTAEQIGVAGFLRKDHSVANVVSALDVIAGGGVVFDSLLSRPVTAEGARSTNSTYYLTPREKEVLHRIVVGQGTIQMSREMDISTSTVRSYVKNMLAKLGVHSRLEAAFRATSENLLTGQEIQRSL